MKFPSPRDSVIISLADACGVFRRILDNSEYQEVKERLELNRGVGNHLPVGFTRPSAT